MGVSALRSCRNDHFLIYLFYLTIFFLIFVCLLLFKDKYRLHRIAVQLCLLSGKSKELE